VGKKVIDKDSSLTKPVRDLDILLDTWEYHKDTKIRRGLRSLLLNLHGALFSWSQDLASAWCSLGLSDLISYGAVRKKYREAILVVHPDRSLHRGDSQQQQLVCKRMFAALNAAWKVFNETEKSAN